MAPLVIFFNLGGHDTNVRSRTDRANGQASCHPSETTQCPRNDNVIGTQAEQTHIVI